MEQQYSKNIVNNSDSNEPDPVKQSKANIKQVIWLIYRARNILQ